MGTGKSKQQTQTSYPKDNKRNPQTNSQNHRMESNRRKPNGSTQQKPQRMQPAYAHQQKKLENNNKKVERNKSDKAECNVCGHEGHTGARCYHRHQTCSICFQPGHLRSVCRQKTHHPDSIYKPKARGNKPPNRYKFRMTSMAALGSNSPKRLAPVMDKHNHSKTIK